MKRLKFKLVFDRRELITEMLRMADEIEEQFPAIAGILCTVAVATVEEREIDLARYAKIWLDTTKDGA